LGIKSPAVGNNFPKQEILHGCCGKVRPLLWKAKRCTVKNNFPKVKKILRETDEDNFLNTRTRIFHLKLFAYSVPP
jgi:hypothetical protein